MSLLSIAVIVLWLFAAVRGFRRGLVRTAISMVSFLLIMILVSAISPVVNRILIERTGIKEQLEVRCGEALETVLPDGTEPDRSQQISVIEELPIPMLLKKELLEHNNSEVYNDLSAETFRDYVSAFLTSAVVQILVYVVSFLLALVVLKVIVNVLDLFAGLPILGGINRLGGFMLGIISGLLYLWIFFLIITVFGGTDLGGYLLREVAGDKILDYLYQNNLLMQFLVSEIV